MYVKFYFCLLFGMPIFIVSTLINYNNMKKLEHIYKVSFITFVTFAWLYFGMHVLIHIIWG